MGELNGLAGAAFLGMASLTRKVETQGAYNKDKRPCELCRRNACRAPYSASKVPRCEHLRHHAFSAEDNSKPVLRTNPNRDSLGTPLK
jgi:hypothetical protein